MEHLLKQNLGDCKRIKTSTCATKCAYEKTNASLFYVFDDPDSTSTTPSKIVTVDEIYQLTVENPESNEISFVKSDKCLFTDATSKCDCILFDDKKLYLVEIKSSSTSTRNKKRHKAVEQLATTAQILIDNGIDLSNLDAKAVICFKRNDIYPIKASVNSQKAIFLEKYNMKLEEGNVIDF